MLDTKWHDRRAQAIWAVLAIAGAFLAIVGWWRWLLGS